MHSKNNIPMIDIKNLSVSFRLYDSLFEQHYLKVISDLTVNVKEGEIMAIAGSSGSGKSLLAHAIMGILPPNSVSSGHMEYMGRPLTPELQKKLRGKEIALIPQSVTYLDPLMRVGAQVRNGTNSKKTRQEQQEAFRRFNLGPEVERMYPFQLSGGMARRVLVSTALVCNASLIIADEPRQGWI
jgi:peptide/nickel transport system ATP-binding protein